MKINKLMTLSNETLATIEHDYRYWDTTTKKQNYFIYYYSCKYCTIVPQNPNTSIHDCNTMTTTWNTNTKIVILGLTNSSTKKNQTEPTTSNDY